jgi:maltooligosyltrehalose trehalohydrolase
MYALLLLGPWTPFLFQGQEFGASTPFIYFCDVGREFREAVRAGRIEFLMQFPSIAKPEVRDCIPVPWDRQVFESCKLDFSEREGNGAFYRFNCDLLRLRREDSRFSEQRFGGVDGAVLGARAFVLRYFGEDNSDRLLIVNFGARLHLDSAPEPLLAPPLGSRWENLWSSDAKAYGGPGEAPVETDAGWNIPAEATVALHPVKRESK